MKILFMLESGSPAYGIPNPGDVDLVVVYVPEDTGHLFRGKVKPDEKQWEGSLLETKLVPVDHYLQHLWKPNVNYAEWLFGKHILAWEDKVAELRLLARGYDKYTPLHRVRPYSGIFALSAINHFHGMIAHTVGHAESEDYSRPKRVLYALRTYLQGIWFFQMRVMINIPEMVRLLEHKPWSKEATDLYRILYAEKVGLQVDEKIQDKAQPVFEQLKEELNGAHEQAESMNWPKVPEGKNLIDEFYQGLIE